jgi:hypothetical protein
MTGSGEQVQKNNLKHGFLRKKNGCEEKNHFTAVFVLIFL